MVRRTPLDRHFPHGGLPICFFPIVLPPCSPAAGLVHRSAHRLEFSRLFSATTARTSGFQSSLAAPAQSVQSQNGGQDQRLETAFATVSCCRRRRDEQASEAVCRGGRWTFRAYVPEDLRPVIDQQEIRKSLGTDGHREAVRLSHIESVKADALFAEARAKPAGGTPDDTPALISDAELQPLARSYLYGLEIEAPPVPLFQEEREARREAGPHEVVHHGGGAQAPRCDQAPRRRPMPQQRPRSPYTVK